MLEGIKQLDVNLIFCFRAKEKTKPVKKDGKTEIVAMGFMPIAGEELVYEMTVNCLLLPKANGVPTWRSDHIGERMMMKEPEQFKSIFANSAPLSQDIGRKLALWAKGTDTPVTDEPMPSDAELRLRGTEEAGKGEEPLRIWWDSIGKPARTRLKDDLPAWRKIAIDAGPAAEEDEI